MIGAHQSDLRRALVASILLCVCLCAAMAVELTSSGGPGALSDRADRTSRAPNALKVSSRFTLPPLETFAEVTERPLFSSSRRPEAVETPENVDQPLNASLAGIVISGSSSSIIVSHGDPPVLTRLKRGDQFDGWSISAIEANRVLLRRGDAQQQFKLHDVPGQAAAATSSRPETPNKPRR